MRPSDSFGANAVIGRPMSAATRSNSVRAAGENHLMRNSRSRHSVAISLLSSRLRRSLLAASSSPILSWSCWLTVFNSSFSDCSSSFELSSSSLADCSSSLTETTSSFAVASSTIVTCRRSIVLCRSSLVAHSSSSSRFTRRAAATRRSRGTGADAGASSNTTSRSRCGSLVRPTGATVSLTVAKPPSRRACASPTTTVDSVFSASRIAWRRRERRPSRASDSRFRVGPPLGWARKRSVGPQKYSASNWWFVNTAAGAKRSTISRCTSAAVSDAPGACRCGTSSAAMARRAAPLAGSSIISRGVAPTRRKMRHRLETGSNRSSCLPTVSAGPRKRKPPGRSAKCRRTMTFFWISGSR